MKKDDLPAIEDIVETIREPLLVLDADLNILFANRSFYNIFKVEERETIGSLIFDVGNKQWDIPALRTLLEEILPAHKRLDNYEVEHDFPAIGRKTMLLNARQVYRNDVGTQNILLAIEDITVRKKVEKALEDNEARYHELVQNANSIILRMDPKGKVTFFNEFAQRFFGYSEEEMLGRSVTGTILPETESSGRDLAFMLQDIEIHPEKHINNENENMRRSGERVWVAWTNKALRDGSGQIMEILCIGNDITEHKRLESLLEESEERYRRLFETANDGILLLDKHEGKITHANPAAAEMLGHSKEECIGKKLQDIGVSLDTGDIQKILQTLDKSGIISYDDVPVKTKSGHYIDTDIYMVDRARLVQCNIRDITGQKRSEKELKFRNIILSTQQEASIDGILVVDESDAIISYNQRFVEMWSIPPNLLESKNDEPVLQYVATKPVDPEGFMARVKYLYQHKKEKSLEDIALKDGRVFERYSSPMFGADGRYYGRVWYFRDITERKRSEAEREELLHALGERIKELDCITKISRLAEEHWNSIDEFVQRAVGILPPAWRYQEICAACITLNSKEFKTANFRKTEWSQSADIKVCRNKFGAVTICYLEEKPAADEGPFLNEERSLINTVADFLGHIIQHRLSEEEIRASEEKFRVIFDNANDGILLMDTESKRIDFANAASCGMLGYSQEEIKDMLVMDIHPQKDISYVIDQFEKHSRREIIVTPGLPMKRKDGSVFYADVSSALVEISGRHYLVGIFRDITERRHMAERLQHLAYYDALTDLPNRTLFLDRVNQAIARAEPTARIVAVIITNIHRFKSINDTYGSEIGDRVLKEIAGRLSTSVRKGDTIARLSNDEFGIALLDVAHPDDIIMVLEKIIKDISYPLKVNEDEVALTFSTGVSLYPNDGSNAAELLKSAGLALAISKKERSKSYRFFTEDLNIKASELILMEKDLHKAIMNKEFILHYQPYWDITTKKMVGMEALVRWQSKDKGLVPPGKFIPILEDTGMIIGVGEWILREAMRQVKEWQNNGYLVVPISVNLSLIQFRQKDLAEMIKRIMGECNFDPSLLTLEITESAFMQNVEFARSVLTAMKEIGCSISIDDFGTGYSSLSYLKRFPVDNLKIDISFIRELAQDPDSASIVMAIVNMAHTLNLKTIAEGIETEEQWKLLRLFRCDMGQGFHLSKPLPPYEVERLFKKQ